MTTGTNDERRIYVACLASYNAGTLHGVWIDVDGKDADDIQGEVAAMLRESPNPNVTVECPDCEGKGYGSHIASCLSPERRVCSGCAGTGKVPSAEEWAIHDHEGFYGLVKEYTPFERVAELAELLDEHGEAFAVYAEHVGDDSFADSDGFQDAYAGEHDTLAAWAEEFMDETGGLDEVPENLRAYFDFEAYARDCRLNGDVFEARGPSGTNYVFWNR